MAAKYKLMYFQYPGIGLPIKYFLSYGNLEFEEVIFDRLEWDKHRSIAPFGRLPILEIDGKQATQSSAICRYLAKQLKLTGKTEWEALEADIIVDTLTDLRMTYVPFFMEQDPEKKAKELEQIKTVHNPFYLSRLEELVKKNGGYFVNGQLTWADIYFAAFAELMTSNVFETGLEGYPNLQALTRKIESLPGIKAFIEKIRSK